MTFLRHPVMCNAWSQLLLHASISQTLSELINSTCIAFEMKFQPLFGICINRIYLCSLSNLCWKFVDFKYIACKWQLQAYVSILWTVSELHELYLHSLQDESPACYLAYVSTRYVSFSSSKQPWKFVYFKRHDCRNSSHSRLCSGISKPPHIKVNEQKMYLSTMLSNNVQGQNWHMNIPSHFIRIHLMCNRWTFTTIPQLISIICLVHCSLFNSIRLHIISVHSRQTQAQVLCCL